MALAPGVISIPAESVSLIGSTPFKMYFEPLSSYDQTILAEGEVSSVTNEVRSMASSYTNVFGAVTSPLPTMGLLMSPITGAMAMAWKPNMASATVNRVIVNPFFMLFVLLSIKVNALWNILV